MKAAIEGRRSVRNFQTGRGVETALLEDLMRLATSAPSAHNRQPWRFAVLRKPAARQRLAQAMGERLRADRLADGDDTEDIARDVDRSYQRICGASALIVLCLTMEDMDRYPDPRRMQAEQHMAIQGVAMAAQNILLAAHANGLGACWMCAPLFAPQVVRQVLDLPESWEPQGLILLGWPARPVRKRNRKPLEDVVRWIED